MTNERITMSELVELQHTLPKLILNRLTKDEKLLLVSFQQVHPSWNLIPVPHLQEMPAVQWNVLNLKKMNKQKHQKMDNKLQETLKI
jgi:DNA-directed RNA polymerase subunit L